MKPLLLIALCLSCCSGALSLQADEPPPLDPHLEPLRPLLEKTWRGVFKNSKPDQPIIDIMRWERALNGKAIRVLHSINDGLYGGETIITWDDAKQSVIYHYFTTAGFRTVGTITFQGGKVITHETVTGNANGISEVRGTNELRSDGTFHVLTEHHQGSEWTAGHEATYTQDASARVTFK